MNKNVPVTRLLDEIRFEWFLPQYNEYLKRKDAKQITFDEFCDNFNLYN